MKTQLKDIVQELSNLQSHYEHFEAQKFWEMDGNQVSLKYLHVRF